MGTRPAALSDGGGSASSRARRRRKQPALVTRAVIAAVSIGTFALLVIGMAPGRPATDPAHLDDTLGTSSTVVGAAATGSTSAALVAVTYIGRLSASLHDPTASASPPAPGRFGVTP